MRDSGAIDALEPAPGLTASPYSPKWRLSSPKISSTQSRGASTPPPQVPLPATGSILQQTLGVSAHCDEASAPSRDSLGP